MTPRQRLAAKIGAGAVALVLPVVMLYEGTVLSTYGGPLFFQQPRYVQLSVSYDY